MRNLIWFFAVWILIGARTATAGHWDDWKEEVFLHDGRVILVERSLYFEFKLTCGDEASLGTFCNVPTTYKISFKHPDTQEEISWKEDFIPAALEIFDKAPYLVAVGPGAPVAMGIYPICNGIPYLYYRYDKGRSRWELLEESAIPKELAKANLGFGYEKRYKGKLLSHAEIARYNQWKEKHISSWFVVNLPKNFHEWIFYNKWDFAASQRRMYRGKDGCKDIKPLTDPEMDESRKVSQQLEDSAQNIVGVFLGLDERPETFTEEQYKAIEGVWGVTWLKPSCKGIVDKVWAPENLTGPYARQITFSNGKRTQFNMNHWFTMTTCSKDMVYAIRRKDHTNLIINRFRATGEMVDVTKVAMEENRMPRTKEWQELLRVQPVSNDELILEFAQLEGYKTNLASPAHRMAVWKAKFKIKLMASNKRMSLKLAPNPALQGTLYDKAAPRH